MRDALMERFWEEASASVREAGISMEYADLALMPALDAWCQSNRTPAGPVKAGLAMACARDLLLSGDVTPDVLRVVVESIIETSEEVLGAVPQNGQFGHHGH